MLVSWLPLRLLATESALDLQNGDTSTVYIYEVIRGDQRETIGQPDSLDAVYRTLNRLSDGLQPPSSEGGLNGELTQGYGDGDTSPRGAVSHGPEQPLP